MDPLNHIRIAFKHPNAFVLIPKTASHTMSAALLGGLGWQSRAAEHVTDIIKDPQAWTFWGLVRHPVDRWVSGICQRYAPRPSLAGASPDYIERVRQLTDPEGMERFITDGGDDQHTRTQSWHFEKLPNTRIYKLENLNLFWNHLGYPNPAENDRMNAASGHKGIVHSKIKKILKKTPKYVSEIIELFDDDMRLWEGAI